MRTKPLISILFSILLTAPPAFAQRVVRVQIQAIPQAESVAEYGFIYSNTGVVPGRLLLYCKDFVDESSWNGLMPGEVKSCGHVDLEIRMTSLGLTAYYMNYSKANPLTFDVYVDPKAPLRSVLGVYVGAKAGAGIAAGGRTMIFRNRVSGIWATAGQAIVPGRPDAPMDIGIDVSVPWLEVYLRNRTNLDEQIASFKKDIPNPTPTAQGIEQSPSALAEQVQPTSGT